MKIHNLILAFATACLLTSCLTKSAPKRPNVIVILADDLGNGDVSYNGCKDIKTPELDLLAKEGIILTDAHTSATVCAPSRAGLMSGRYQQRYGFECNAPGGKNGLPGSAVTYAEAMKAAGYETMALGKWHLGYKAEHHPNAQGFDHYTGFTAGGRSYWPLKRHSSSHSMQRNGKYIDEKEITYVTDFLTDEAIDMIEKRDQTKPFFMYLSYNAPHTPMHALPEDLELYKHIKNRGRRTYAAMVHNMDKNIGKLRAWLKAKGLAEDTMVIFTSDNGGATTNSSDNGIYRGMKGSKWEGGHRVPTLISWPAAGIKGGKKSDVLVSTLDFMSTSLAAAGAEDQIEKLKLDGVDLIPSLQESAKTAARDTLFWRRSVAAGVRQGDWKLLRVEEKNKSFRYLLFNLKNDPSETTDLYGKYPKKEKAFKAMLENWEKTLNERNWGEGDFWEENQRKKHKMSVIGRKAERSLP